MTKLQRPWWDADRYIYRITSPTMRAPDGTPFTWGTEYFAMSETLFALGADETYALLVAMAASQMERHTGVPIDPASLTVALVDDRFPEHPLATDVLALRDTRIRDELRKQRR